MTTASISTNDPLGHATAILTAAGISISETRQLPHGWQLRGEHGEAVSVFKTGKVLIQGQRVDAVTAAFKATSSDLAGPSAAPPPRSIKPAPVAAVSVDLPALPSRRPEGWSDEPWDQVTPPF